jgi:hypothetical protein
MLGLTPIQDSPSATLSLCGLKYKHTAHPCCFISSCQRVVARFCNTPDPDSFIVFCGAFNA